MQRSFPLFLGAAACLVLAALIALPALASSKDDEGAQLIHSDDVIFSGVDLWVTPADGWTYSDFSEQPIPAGFFCPGSSAFSGKIDFQGASLASVPANAIGGADTIIERLDDAVFNAQGVATTRLRFLALSLVSVEPLQTECGQFEAHLRLEGEQPLTSMRIQRQSAFGGVYASDISVRAKLSFTPLSGGMPLELSQKVRFDHREGTPWASLPGRSSRPAPDYAKVDVDGDGQAETVIPGPGNFFAGSVLRNGVLTPLSNTQPIQVQGILETVAIAAPTCHCNSEGSFDDNPEKVEQKTTGCYHLHCPSAPGVYEPVEGTTQ